MAESALKPPLPAGQYQFNGIVTKQATNNSGNLILTVEVPWEHRGEVFRALDEMPFACLIHMTGTERHE